MSKFDGYTKVDVKKVQLTSLNSKKSLNIYNMVQQIEIYSSIFDPVTIGTISISDGSSLIQTLPIVGEELLELEFVSPNRKPFKRMMHVYKIENMAFDPNGTHIQYVLHFASFDYYQGAKNNVSQAYKDNISSILKGLLKTQIQTDKNISVEDTKGIEHIVIPSWTCWQIVEFLRKRAVSPRYHSPYIFFEDQSGYHFKTYEKLIEERKGNIKDLTFTADSYMPGAAADTGKNTIQSSQYRNVIDLTVDSKANTDQLLQNGGISARVTVFDIMDKSVRTVDVKVGDAKKIVRNPLDKTFNPSHSEGFNQTTKPTVQWMMPYNQTHSSSSPEQLTKKALYAAMLQETIISFTTMGDTQIQPGDVIKFIMPSRVENGKPDTQLSGNYIIGNMRHGLAGGEMLTTIEAFKIGSQERII